MNSLAFDLFTPWPESPPATAENRVLPLQGTNQGRYDLWLATEDGERVYEAIRVRALALAATGATRISINLLMEQVRGALRLPCDNTYRALIGRDLVEECPVLRDLIELRQRRSA